MKRYFLVIVILVVIGSLLYPLISNLFKTYSPSDFLPERALVYIEFDSPTQSLERFKRSRLWRQIESIDWLLVVRELGLSEDQVINLKNNIKVIKDIYNSSLFKELFLKQAVVALVPPRDQTDINVEDMLDNLVLIVQPRHNALVIDKLTSMISHGDLLEEKHQGVNIKTFSLGKNRSVSAAILDKMLIISLSSERVKECLDIGLTSSNSNRRLASEADFHDLRSGGWGKKDLFVFVDTRTMIEELKLISNSRGQLLSPETLARLESMQTRTLSMVQKTDKDLINCQITLGLDQKRQGVFQSFFIDPVSLQDRFSLSIPAEVLLYSRTNWFDMKSLWHSLFSNPRGRNKEIVENVEKWLRQKTGREPTELLSMFGDEFSLFVPEITTSGFFPVPSLSLCFKVEDQAGVQELMHNALADLDVKQSVIDGVPIFSVIVAGGLMQPSYVLLDHYLFAADSRKQIESILRKDKNILKDDPDFQKVNKKLRKSVNFKLFARTEKLNDGLQELISWAGTIIAIRDVKAGAKSKILIDQIILPIMEGLKMYKLVGVSGFHQNSNLVLQAAIAVEQLEN